MTQFEPDDIRAAAITPRWAALTTLGQVAGDLNNYDRFLIRNPRLLVPIDVQALVVRANVNDTEPMIPLPFRSDPTVDPAPNVHDKGNPRAPGVHLLWSVPAALGRGRIIDDPQAPGDTTRRLLALPALPDRWVVVRLAVPVGASEPAVAAWVVEADSATVTPLAAWPSAAGTSLGVTVPAAQLNSHVGGLGWTQCYDAALGRLAIHDPLDDLAGTELEGDAVTYLVAGWWADTSHDPLDGVGTDTGYRQRLAELGWNDPDHPSPDDSRRADADERHLAATMFGLPTASRYQQEVLPAGGKAASATPLSGIVARGANQLNPAISGFLHEAKAAAALPPAPTQSTLLHGRVHGVPITGAVAPESRPAPDAVRSALGATTPDLAAAMSVAGTELDQADQDARRAAERLLAAFASNDIAHLGDSNAWADIEEWEHAHGYGSLPGGTEGVDRFVDRPGAASDPGATSRPGTAAPTALSKAPPLAAEATILWNPVQRPTASMRINSVIAASATGRRAIFDGVQRAVPPDPPATVREVARPAPRFHYPAAPVLAVAGGGRLLSTVEREEAAGQLACRLSDQTSKGQAGVLAATELLTTIGSAAVPDEVLDLAREALAEDPYLAAWRTRKASSPGGDIERTDLRMRAESALTYAYYAADNAMLGTLVGTEVSSAATRQRAVEGLARLSLSTGVWAHPEGVTMWGQPWRPMFCDWEVKVDLGPLDGWALTGVDLEAGEISTPDALTFTGRSPVVTGVATSLSAAIDRWLDQERKRDLGGHGLADPATEAALSALRDTLARLDLMSIALDGIREQLLGLHYDRGLVHDDEHMDEDGSPHALAVALPRLLAAGRLRVAAARLVDSFGRTLELPLDAVLVAARLADEDPHALQLPPRLTAPARWRFDLVDATSTGVTAALANVDQADPTKQVNPIVGFLLPDHMDESLEVFAADGTPLGELLHDGFSGAVSWEIAPGRTDVAPAAGPTDDPDPSHHRVGWIAAGVVAADAATRSDDADRAETESALSAMLRAIDTTLWTVDPFGSLGQSHIAGLVGRPIAVVAARLALDLRSDAGELAYADGLHEAGRQARYDALAAQQFELRLGEITRTDDGLLGYFVDDDYAHFHVVDPQIALQALPSGRGQGELSDDGGDPNTPKAITHDYITTDGVLRIRPGQTIRLTLLMHPGGKVHLTSGVLPRTAQALARDWVDPGLSRLAPSLRTGPLLVDADKVRLPKVASFPAEQLFTRRDTPTSWKDDPILAATQSALLPDQSPVIQEGWVRINPNPPAPGSPA
jgi:hypothetical protein